MKDINPKPELAAPVEVDLFSPEIMEMVRESSQLYRRRIDRVRSVRFPEETELVYTTVNGSLETANTAIPGRHMVITGVQGEEYVQETSKIGTAYDLIPRERLAAVLPNPFSTRVRIRAPWSTSEAISYQEGDADALFIFSIDADGALTADRYIVANRDLLEANYEPVDIADETEQRIHAAKRLVSIWHGIKGHPASEVVFDTLPYWHADCGATGTRADLYM